MQKHLTDKYKGNIKDYIDVGIPTRIIINVTNARTAQKSIKNIGCNIKRRW
ncbi:MAG: hypothetical protein KAX39_04825 [candidate division Zixibacteria bacterium]|nr:hypothetical protein [candidate division Zixibacteria bacterium]